jgi:outer membrane protein OmpA-like peptidoglycan-associated protein
MLVGNFSPKDYQKVAQGRYSRSFYICDFIDDIRIEPIVKRPCPDCQRTRDSIYLVSQQLFSDQRLAPPKPVATAKVEVRKIDTVELPSLLFELNSSKMLDSSVLDQYKSIFLDTGIQRIVVAGYTDSTGGKEYNSALAANRAQAVAEQIGKRFGITPGIIEQTGRGISYKYAEMDKNRRVEIYIYRK